MFLSSLSTKKLKPTNNSLYLEKKKKENKKIGFFFLFIFIGTEMPKFWENSGLLYDKTKIIKKVNFSFFSDCYVPNPKVHPKALI